MCPFFPTYEKCRQRFLQELLVPKEQDSFTRASFAKSKTLEKTEELPGLLFNMCPLFEPTTNAHRDFTAALFAPKKRI